MINKREQLAEQMLALLVMDLDYREEPTYGCTPLRHQRAWQMMADELGDFNIRNSITRMLDQIEEEKGNE